MNAMQVKTNFELDRYADLLDCMDAITLEVRLNVCVRASISMHTTVHDQHDDVMRCC